MPSPAGTSSPPASAIISTRSPTCCSAVSCCTSGSTACSGPPWRSPPPAFRCLPRARSANCGSAWPCASTFALYGLLRKIVARRRGHRPRDRDRDPVPARARSGSAGRHSAGAAGDGHNEHADRPAAARRHRFDDAAAAVHRRRQAPALFDARHAPVHRADAAVPDRRLLYGEPLHHAPTRSPSPAIWIALALYVVALLRAPRLPQPPE